MDAKNVATAVQTVVIVGYAGVMFWRGFRRRKPHWSASSWLPLGVTLLAGAALLGFALAFSFAVDNHAPWVGPPRSDTRVRWITISLGAMIAGVALLTTTLLWFSRGDPERPFPLLGRPNDAPRPADSRSSSYADLD